MMPKICFFHSGVAYFSLAAALVAVSTTAQADVTISSAATQNITCSNGICAPTAKKAVLNVGDLETLLASGNVEVTTTGSAQANNIVIGDAFSWSAASGLTLDAYQSVSINKGIAVQGQGGLALTTNDGGTGGALVFGHKGSVTFANLSSSLTINGVAYTLVNTIQTLAAAIAANPSGAYALAADYDASQDGTYTTVPVPTPFTGTFEGLGNKISKLSINDANDTEVGLLSQVNSSGTLRDVSVTSATISVGATESFAGPIVGVNYGTINDTMASGSVVSLNWGAGGLVGLQAGGIILLSNASTKVSGPQAGGLVGRSDAGSISQSFSTGKTFSTMYAGGLTGIATGATITNCYSTGAAQVSKAAGDVGGFAASVGSTVEYSYSTGSVKGGRNTTRGGFVGYAVGANFLYDYWDTDKSGFTNIHKGVGNEKNEPGVTGLTTKLLQANLPEGFAPKIWGEDPKINDGLPYLLANFPR